MIDIFSSMITTEIKLIKKKLFTKLENYAVNSFDAKNVYKFKFRGPF